MHSSSETVVLIATAATIVLTTIAFILVTTAAATRSLFVVCVCCLAIAGAASAALTAEGAPFSAIALAYVGGALFPALLLGGMLLSTNSAKAGRKGGAWFSLLAAFASVGLILAITPEFGAGVRAPPQSAPVGFGALLTALVFVACVGAIGLLGFGERGALDVNRPSVNR